MPEIVFQMSSSLPFWRNSYQHVRFALHTVANHLFLVSLNSGVSICPRRSLALAPPISACAALMSGVHHHLVLGEIFLVPMTVLRNSMKRLQISMTGRGGTWRGDIRLPLSLPLCQFLIVFGASGTPPLVSGTGVGASDMTSPGGSTLPRRTDN